MSLEHNSYFPATRKGNDVDAEDRTYITSPITHRNEASHRNAKLSDDISSREHHSRSASFAPAIPGSNKTPYDSVDERDVTYEQPQAWASTPKSPSPHLHHHYQETPEDAEKRYIENLRRERHAALSAECDQIQKQKIDTTRGSIRGIFGRGRHRDAWLIGCDTDATDFGSKTEGKIDAGRDSLSSYGTGRDKMVGTIVGRERLAREQDVRINSLLASRKCCTRRRMGAGGAGVASGTPTVGNSSLDGPEASRNDEEISVVRR